MPCVVWAKESKTGLGFEIGPSHGDVPTTSQCATAWQSSCMIVVGRPQSDMSFTYSCRTQFDNPVPRPFPSSLWSGVALLDGLGGLIIQAASTGTTHSDKLFVAGIFCGWSCMRQMLSRADILASIFIFEACGRQSALPFIDIVCNNRHCLQMSAIIIIQGRLVCGQHSNLAERNPNMALQLDCWSATRTRMINLPTNQKGYGTFETTVGKLSERRIQIFPVYFCLGIILKVILNNFQNNV